MRDPLIDRLEVARDALSKAVTLVPVKQLHSMAAAAEVYARQQGLSEDSIGFAHQVKIEALARLGEIMEITPKAKGTDRGGRPKIDGSRKIPSISPLTLADQGVDKKTAHLARRLSELSDVDLNAVAARDKTLAAVTRENTAAVRETRIALPDAKYRVVYADPPWKYNDKADTGAIQSGGAEHHYPSMSIDDLCALDIKSICDQDAVALRSTCGCARRYFLLSHSEKSVSPDGSTSARVASGIRTRDVI